MAEAGMSEPGAPTDATSSVCESGAPTDATSSVWKLYGMHNEKHISGAKLHQAQYETPSGPERNPIERTAGGRA